MAKDPRQVDTSTLRFEDDTVRLIVGGEATALAVHRLHLEHASPFFQAALKKCRKEGKEREIPLPDDDAETVDLYLNFLYTGMISCKPPRSANTGEDKFARSAEGTRLAMLYVFGEKHMDVCLKYAVIDAIVAKSQSEQGKEGYLIGGAVDIIYRGTSPGSPARRLMVEMHISHGRDIWLDEDVNNSEFAVDLVREMLQRHVAPYQGAIGRHLGRSYGSKQFYEELGN